ncbi:aldo/keto reductases, related to diketogulonate reductase [Longilinea arvoryzae]|uniref:Aldo/keto reductases, related to diketogulonate reductase n=2 Tax=Longilinea arvoryzae TaxID=360412 RepID=A0A0S7BNZ6_9CHLR|nr:aldo/keto reductases, related to diketogulonate reductase [Longilinea arvoryzae]
MTGSIILWMRYETIRELLIPKIGFGTWTIGGQENADLTGDDRFMAALRSALELGYTLFDTAEVYAAGHAEELLGKAVRESGVARDKLFLTSKVSPDHLAYEDVLRCCESSLRRLEMDYLDLYLIHWPKQGMNLPETFRALNVLVRQGKVRHLGVSNFNLKLLKQAERLAETPLLTDQVSYCVPDRTYVLNGVLEYCQQNDILLTAYTPVKHRFVKGNKNLLAMAGSRGVSPYQIALAWLTTQPRVITIPMSLDPRHQAENLLAADIRLSEEEMQRLA